MPKDKGYEVVWRIDISAKSPLDAARQALEIHRDPFSTATFFEVINKKTKKLTIVDMEEHCDSH